MKVVSMLPTNPMKDKENHSKLLKIAFWIIDWVTKEDRDNLLIINQQLKEGWMEEESNRANWATRGRK